MQVYASTAQTIPTPNGELDGVEIAVSLDTDTGIATILSASIGAFKADAATLRLICDGDFDWLQSNVQEWADDHAAEIEADAMAYFAEIAAE